MKIIIDTRDKKDIKEAQDLLNIKSCEKVVEKVREPSTADLVKLLRKYPAQLPPRILSTIAFQSGYAEDVVEKMFNLLHTAIDDYTFDDVTTEKNKKNNNEKPIKKCRSTLKEEIGTIGNCEYCDNTFVRTKGRWKEYCDDKCKNATKRLRNANKR